jgi:hypothetical protein
VLDFPNIKKEKNDELLTCPLMKEDMVVTVGLLAAPLSIEVVLIVRL